GVRGEVFDVAVGADGTRRADSGRVPDFLVQPQERDVRLRLRGRDRLVLVGRPVHLDDAAGEHHHHHDHDRHRDHDLDERHSGITLLRHNVPEVVPPLHDTVQTNMNTAVLFAPSLAVSFTVYPPAVVGVPVSLAVPLLSVMPAGRPVAVHVTLPLPPLVL